MKKRTFNRGIVYRVLLIVALAVGMASLPGGTVSATTLTVTSTADSGAGSLRQIIAAAAPGDTITFNASLNGQTIYLLSEIVVANNLTITGPGMDLLTISGNTTNRIFNITATTVSISGLTFASGNSGSSDGGAILSGGALNISAARFRNNAGATGGAINVTGASTLMVADSVFDSNSASALSGYGGGAICSGNGNIVVSKTSFTNNTARGNGGGAIATTMDSGSPTITIAGSSFSNNRATDYDGGAIYSNGDLTITDSTLSGNFAVGDGGAIKLLNGEGILTNVTITGNSANNNGGGFYYRDDVDAFLNNITIASNRADAVNDGSGDGGGFYHFAFGGTPAQFRNSILAGNISLNGAPDCSGTFDSQGYNLIQNTAGCTIIGVTSGNLTGQNPNLAALAYNGGSTQTRALQSGSPAIDAGNSAGCLDQNGMVIAADQRGVARPVGVHCDIGAFEYDVAPIVTSSSPANGAQLAAGINSLKVIFKKDVLHNSSASAANNAVNYLLVEAGTNGIFDTLSCLRGRVADDTQIIVNSASYDAGTFTATLGVNGGVLLPYGNYKLFVCGTTSITDPYGLKLNYGLSDATVNFHINAPAAAVPATGFAPNRVTLLPPQTVSYAAMGDLWLEIPKLGVQMNIVGVPQSGNGTWDVSWLGQDAGWLNGSAFPTWSGNSVLTGHVWNADNTPGPFRYLNTLWWGDKVIIHASGTQYIYEVRSVQQVSPGSTAAMMKHEDLPWVTLVTCRGYDAATNSYQYRVLVRAVLVAVK